jgi:integrase
MSIHQCDHRIELLLWDYTSAQRLAPFERTEEMRFLTVPEIDTLAESMAARYKALVLVAAFGGLRIGELAGLRRGRVDILRDRIEVAEISVEVDGHLHFGPPKSRAGRRSVTLPRSVMRVLNDHLAEFTDDHAEAFVFTGPEGGPLRVPLWRQRFWKPAVEAAGLAPLTPHDLRHTAVALWIASGANVLEVCRRAGHTSASFTLDRYGHLFPEADTAVADRLDALIAAVAENAVSTVTKAPRSKSQAQTRPKKLAAVPRAV